MLNSRMVSGLTNLLFNRRYVNPQLDYDDISTSTPPVTAHKNKMDVILGERVVSINDGKIQYFLICWIDRHASYAPHYVQSCEKFEVEVHEYWLFGVHYQYLVRRKEPPPLAISYS
ncbi:Hypothetical predicted protein [Olea europaea subsp. europaea]|nr:Hypothetical predicted protein [Olea europaea subsp. europaea]